MENIEHSSLTVEVTDATFADVVHANKLPVVVDFWAPWCGPCKAIFPYIDKLAEDYAGKVVIAKLNIDTGREKMKELGLRGVPSFGFYIGSKLVDSCLGFRGYADMKTRFDSLIVEAGAAAQALSDKQRKAEESYAQSVEAAEQAWEDAITPADAAYQTAAAQPLEVYNAESRALVAALAEGFITAEERDTKLEAAQQVFMDATVEARQAYTAIMRQEDEKKAAALKKATQEYERAKA